MADLPTGNTGVPSMAPHDIADPAGALPEEAAQAHPHEEEASEDAQLAPMTPLYRVGFLLTSMVAGLSSVCIKQLLLPIQVSLLDPAQTNTAFALVASLGALAGLLAAPLTGALSDRTVSRWGRRRPWIAAGILVGVLGLLLMAAASSIPMLLLGEILEQLGVDAVLANVTALIPDQIPQDQRASASALNGMAPVVGGVLGLVLVTGLTNPHVVAQGYLLLALLSLLCVLPFLRVLRERPLRNEAIVPWRLRAFLAGFVRPLATRDFALTLLSRLMIFLAFTLLGSYLLFSLRVRLQAPLTQAARGVTTFQLLSTSVLILAALLTGTLARRTQRLKPCALLGALFMAVGLSVLAAFPSWVALWPAALLFGTGFGSYLGIDILLAVRVLPSARERGKDLGIMYTAIFLPLIVTPLIGAFILNVFQENFAALFSVAVVASLLAAGLILPIRAVQ